MSTLFKNDMQRNLEEDAALTVQRPRQSLQEDRSPDESVMMSAETEAEQFEQPEEDGNNVFFDGLLAALRRSIN